MTEVSHVYAGVVRSVEGGRGGVFRQAAGEERWEALTEGLPDETEVHAITVHPDDPDIVFIGTTRGAFRSANRGGSWQRLALPNPTADVWSITVHPCDQRTIYAGFGPIGVYRSDNGGDRWQQLADPGLPNQVHMTFPCRVMRLDASIPPGPTTSMPASRRTAR